MPQTEHSVCQLCGFVSRSNQQLSGHLRCSHNLWRKDHEDYYNQYLNNGSEGFCKTCRLPTKFSTIFTGYQKYCSHRCHMLQEAKVRNPMDKPGTKERLSKAIKKHSKEYSLRMTGERNPMKRPEQQERMRKNNPMKRPEQRERMRKSNPMFKVEYLRKMLKTMGEKSHYASIPQKELFSVVKEIFPEAILEFPFLRYCLDIAVLEMKLDIEYDGPVYHGSSFEQFDNKRDLNVCSEGWKVLRYKETIPTFNELQEHITKLSNTNVLIVEGR